MVSVEMNKVEALESQEVLADHQKATAAEAEGLSSQDSSSVSMTKMTPMRPRRKIAKFRKIPRSPVEDKDNKGLCFSSSLNSIK